MDGNVNSNDNLATANNDAGDAVGVSQPFRWYVAIVSNNTEKVCAEKIAALGYDTYVPTQKMLTCMRCCLFFRFVCSAYSTASKKMPLLFTYLYKKYYFCTGVSHII